MTLVDNSGTAFSTGNNNVSLSGGTSSPTEDDHLLKDALLAPYGCGPVSWLILNAEGMSNDGEHGPPEFGEGLLISEFVEIKACFGFGGTNGFGLMGGFIGLTSKIKRDKYTKY